jgi:subtilisin-like proprotein convertase family protein
LLIEALESRRLFALDVLSSSCFALVSEKEAVDDRAAVSADVARRVTEVESTPSRFSLPERSPVLSASGRVFEDWDGDSANDFDDKGIGNHLVYLDSNLNGTLDSTYSSFPSSTPVNIPDNGPAVTSSIIVSGFTQNMSDINVNMNINHSYVEDLRITLIAPDGTRVPLVDGVWGDGDDFTNTTLDDEASVSITGGVAPFTGSFRPISPLSVLYGTSANGTWSLEIQDTASGDVGTLLNWSVQIGLSEPVAATNSDGDYEFYDLAPGTYRVTTTLPIGLTLTTVSSYDVEILPSADPLMDLDFGFYKLGRFYGRVFNDADSDGVQGPTEEGVAGQTLVWENDLTFDRTFVSSIPVPIPDRPSESDPPGQAISNLMVSELPSQIVDVNVTLNIQHSWVSDLDVFLRSPGGILVELFTDVGGSGSNFTGTILDDSASVAISSGFAPFTGSFRPEGVLADFQGSDPNGEWSLILSDDSPFDAGTLLNWSLHIVSEGDFRNESDALGRAFMDLPSGTHTLRLETELGSGWVYTQPSNGQRTVSVPSSMFNQTYGIKAVLVIDVDSSAVSGPEGTTIQQTGTWVTPAGMGSFDLTASVGTVVKNNNGTWLWSIVGADDTPATVVTITADNGLGDTSSVVFTYSVTNADPLLTVSQSSVTGFVLSTLTNAGTWSDVPSDTVTLSASLGSIVKNGDGTWSWSLTAGQSYTNQPVVIMAVDEDGGATQVQFTIDAIVAVVNSRVYYKGSVFANTSVDAALDTSKVLAKSNASTQTLTFANLINTTRGINGLVFDIAGSTGIGVTAADFAFRMSPVNSFNESTNPPSSWTPAPAPTLVHVTPGTANSPTRIRLEWANNAIANRWLQIKILANSNTGLASPEVYYLGHLYGEANGAVAGGVFHVSNADVTAMRPTVGSLATPNSGFDLDKNGIVSVADIIGVRLQAQSLASLRVITIPPSGSANEGEGNAGRFAAGGTPVINPSNPVSERTASATPFASMRARRTDELLIVAPLAIGPMPDFAADISGASPSKEREATSESSLDSLSLDSYFQRLGAGWM